MLPGQIFDGQAGLHYNMARYYGSQAAKYVQNDLIGLNGGVNTYTYAGSNPISDADPSGLMCIANVGCWITPAERNAVSSGDYNACYLLACAGGDATACFDQHVAANNNFWGHRATNRLLDKLRKKAEADEHCIDDDRVLDQIRSDLARDYANSLPNSLNQARWPSAKDIAHYH